LSKPTSQRTKADATWLDFRRQGPAQLGYSNDLPRKYNGNKSGLLVYFEGESVGLETRHVRFTIVLQVAEETVKQGRERCNCGSSTLRVVLTFQ
jgi:hypothetical protein